MTEQVNPYTIRPDELEQGQYALFTVKIMITRPGRYRVYRCTPGIASPDGVPQGTRIYGEDYVCRSLFPTLYNNASPDD